MNDERPFWEGELWKQEMAPMLDLPDEEPPEVYPYLIAGLEQARDQVLEDLNGFAYSFVTQFGRLAVEWKQPIQIEPGQAAFFEWPLLDNVWFKKGSELVLAEMALDRAALGFERLPELRAVGSSKKLGDRASRYLREVSQLFLLGFDGPCIAFCGAALEQVLKDALVRSKRLSEKDATDRKFTGGELLALAGEEDLLTASVHYAKRLMDERNRAMHRHLWDIKIIRQMAAISVADLTRVLTELASTAPEK